MTMADNFTDAEVDMLLERFDQTEPALQRRIVAQFVADRERLLQAQTALFRERDEARRGLESYREHAERVMGAAGLCITDGRGNVPFMAAAWQAVWRELFNAGMGSFIDSLTDDGLTRATKFIRHLAAERDQLRRRVTELEAQHDG